MYIYKRKLRETYNEYREAMEELRNNAMNGLHAVFAGIDSVAGRELIAHTENNRSNSDYWIGAEYCKVIINILGKDRAGYGLRLFDNANVLCRVIDLLQLPELDTKKAQYDEYNRAFLAVMQAKQSESYQLLIKNVNANNDLEFVRDFVDGYYKLSQSLFDLWDCLGLTDVEVVAFRAAIQKGNFDDFALNYPSRLMNYLVQDAEKKNDSEFRGIGEANKTKLLQWYLDLQPSRLLSLGCSVNLAFFGAMIDNAKVREFIESRGRLTALIIDNSRVTDDLLLAMSELVPELRYLSVRCAYGLGFEYDSVLFLANLLSLDITGCCNLQTFKVKLPKLNDLYMCNSNDDRYQRGLVYGVGAYICFRTIVEAMNRNPSIFYIYVDPEATSFLEMLDIIVKHVNRSLSYPYRATQVRLVSIKPEYKLQLMLSYHHLYSRLFPKNTFWFSERDIIRGDHCDNEYQHISNEHIKIFSYNVVPYPLAKYISLDEMPSIEALSSLLEKGARIEYLRFASGSGVNGIEILTATGAINYSCSDKEYPSSDLNKLGKEEWKPYLQFGNDALFIIDANSSDELERIRITYQALVSAIGVSDVWQFKVSKESFGSATCCIVRDNGLIKALLTRSHMTHKVFDISTVVSQENTIVLTDDLLLFFHQKLISYCVGEVKATRMLTLDVSHLTAEVPHRLIEHLIKLISDYGNIYLRISGLEQTGVLNKFLDVHLSISKACARGDNTIGVGRNDMSHLLLIPEEFGINCCQHYGEFLRSMCGDNRGGVIWAQRSVAEIDAVISLLMASDMSRRVLVDYMKASEANYCFVVNCIHEYLTSTTYQRSPTEVDNNGKVLMLVNDKINLLFPGVIWQNSSVAIFALYAECWSYMDAVSKSDAKILLRSIKPQWVEDEKCLSNIWAGLANVTNPTQARQAMFRQDNSVTLDGLVIEQLNNNVSITQVKATTFATTNKGKTKVEVSPSDVNMGMNP